MKTTIEVEQFDNGISIKWKDAEGKYDPSHLVAHDREKEAVIGKMLLDDIKHFMDESLADKVRMIIEYEPIKGEKE